MIKRDIKGELDKDSLPVILHTLANRKLTGTLRLSSGDLHIELCVEDGKVVFALTNITHLLPAEFLFEWEYIDLELYEELKSENILDFETIREMKVIDGRRLTGIIRKQVREIIFEALSWRRGEYFFSYTPCSGRSKFINLNLYDLLIRGLVREKDWDYMRRVLRPYTRVPVFDSSIDKEEAKGIKLTREESYVLRLIDGRRTLLDIIKESELSDFFTARILYAFILSRIVVFS